MVSNIQGKMMKKYIIDAFLSANLQFSYICIRPHLCVEQINNIPFLTKFFFLYGEIQSLWTQ